MSSYIKKAEYIFLITAAAVGICYVLSNYGGYISGILVPFFIAGICSHFLSPPVRYLHERLHIPKWIACIFIVLTFFGAILTVAYLIIARLMGELSGISEYARVLRDELPRYIENVRDFFSEKLPFFASSDDGGRLSETVAGFAVSLAESAAGQVSRFLSAAVSFVPRFVISAAVTVLATCYITADLKLIKRFFLHQLPGKAKVFFSECRIQLFDTMSRYFGAYMTIALITFAELFVGLMTVRREYAFILALVITLVDILPFFGSGTVLIPWAVAEFIAGDPVRGIKLAVIYIIVTVVRQMAEPRILGSFTGLHPLAALFAIFAGGKLFGIAGMFAFPILAIVIKNLNEKKLIRLFDVPPEDAEEKIFSARSKYKRYRKSGE